MSDNKRLDLSFLDEVDDFLENDAPSELSLKLSQGQILRHASRTTEEKEHQSIKNAEHSLSFESKNQAHEIFWKCWGEDRGEKLYKKLAEEYNVGTEGIINLVRGSRKKEVHIYCPVSYSELTKMKTEWEEKYNSYKIIIKSPGYVHLNDYDNLYTKTEQYNKVAEAWKLTLPSVVYYCRYNLENPTPQNVREYCDSIGIPRIKNDLGQYKQLLNRFKWLNNTSGDTYEFSSYTEAAEFMTAHVGNKMKKKITREKVFDLLGMSWRDVGDFPGWIIEKVDLK
jgi:hypothetical protein